MNAGNYTALIVGAEATQSSNGTPCMELKVEIDDEGVPATRTIFTYFSTKKTDGAKKSVESNLRMLTANGWNGSMSNPLFENAEITVRLKYETYREQERERWEFHNRGYQSEPMQDNFMKALEKKAQKMINTKGEGDVPLTEEDSPF